MSDAQHTKGPWLYRPHTHDDWGFVRSGDGSIVAVAGAGGPYDASAHRLAKTDPFEANARLIAAAPDLLEALEKIAGRPLSGLTAQAIALAALSKEEGMGSVGREERPSPSLANEVCEPSGVGVSKEGQP